MTYEFAQALNAHLATLLARIGFHYEGQDMTEKKDGSIKVAITIAPGIAIRTYKPMGKGFHTNYEAVIKNIEAYHAEADQAAAGDVGAAGGDKV